MSSPYTNAPLDTIREEFRLVELQPSGPRDTIKCSLQTYALPPASTRYIALSYRWGKLERYDDIELNGVLYPVGRSLWTYLHEMRLQGCFYHFWIDAICIDQSKVSERNHQVQLMRTIYSGAHFVSIWLGEQEHPAMDIMATGSSCHELNLQQAKMLLDFSLNPYWSRVWIIQEVVLAKMAIIHCGSQELDWAIFKERIFDVLKRFDDTVEASVRSVLLKFWASSASRVALYSARQSMRLKGDTIGAMTKEFSKCEATDPRDKVYALLGLAVDGSETIVDYRLSPEHLYRQVTSINSCYEYPRMSGHAAQILAGNLGVEYAREELLLGSQHLDHSWLEAERLVAWHTLNTSSVDGIDTSQSDRSLR